MMQTAPAAAAVVQKTQMFAKRFPVDNKCWVKSLLGIVSRKNKNIRNSKTKQMH
jgi:hypothetical protein